MAINSGAWSAKCYVQWLDMMNKYTDYIHIPEGYKTRMVKLVGNNIINNKINKTIYVAILKSIFSWMDMSSSWNDNKTPLS